jgi:hypothetical protein
MNISEILSIGANKRHFKELISHCADGNVVPFIGAGMSVPVYKLWADVLMDVTKNSFDSTFPQKVKSCIDKNEYETAASLILDELGEGEFYSAMADEFSRDKIKSIKTMAVSMLPKIFSGLVITTNFEKMLEVVYDNANESFVGITYHTNDGNIINEVITKGIANNEHFLIKIHGDIDSERSLILTKEKYDEVYGNDTLFKHTLSKIFDSKQLLFLGCSLKNDRTMQIYKQVKDVNKIYSYAFVKRPKDVDL